MPNRNLQPNTPPPATAQRAAYGGQAVIEGVMIRGKDRVVTACRVKDGTITVRRDIADGLTQRYRWLKLAFLRGTPALIDSMRLGYRTLMWSADLAMEGEEQEKPAPWHVFLTVLVSLAIGIGLFIMLPTYVTNFIPGAAHRGHLPGSNFFVQFIPTPGGILPNLLEGLIRIFFLVGYILIFGRNAELRRVFAYHGAEHKVVNAWEHTGELSVETAKGFSRIHPRCGTSFLFLAFFVGIVVHALIGWPDNHLVRMLSRLILLPIIAGIAYELIRLSGKYYNSVLLRILIWPGLLLQRLTTAEPDDDQIEVAIISMRTVLEDEGVLTPVAEIQIPVPPAIDGMATA